MHSLTTEQRRIFWDHDGVHPTEDGYDLMGDMVCIQCYDHVNIVMNISCDFHVKVKVYAYDSMMLTSYLA